jgi:hypothetical protein
MLYELFTFNHVISFFNVVSIFIVSKVERPFLSVVLMFSVLFIPNLKKMIPYKSTRPEVLF